VHERIKSMMHQDPDVIVVGEITDEPTAVAAAHAALSGHKVFSTIHSDDSFGATLRLMEMGLRTYLLSSTGMAVITQRLVRRICENCKEQFTPPRDLFKQFKLRDFDPDQWQFYRGKGCSNCNHSGYYGRTGVCELLVLDDEIRNALLSADNSSGVRRVAEHTHNYISLREAGFIKALQGDTTLEEAMAQLSYSEQQAFSSAGFSRERIDYWMGKTAGAQAAAAATSAEIEVETSSASTEA
jgi:type II secretory ATPase GspE/PulE/Tfp pilus assembly ATPase PilB-like protein